MRKEIMIMRRIKNLENSLYRRKYTNIYKLLFTADLDVVSDHSNWYKENKDYIDIKRPLWIIVESKILNKRIWITEDFGDLEISTAQLDLDVKTAAYSNSFIHTRFKNQKEMVNFLKQLLEPCLEENIEHQIEEREEEEI